MTHNALSRSIGQVPMWLIQAVVGILLTSGVAWATWASVSTWKHEQRIAVVETKVDAVKDDIADIKATQKEAREDQKEQNRKLDRILEMQRRGR